VALIVTQSRLEVYGQTEPYAYVSGHHRGIALHALLYFRFKDKSTVENWLLQMALGVPADMVAISVFRRNTLFQNAWDSRRDCVCVSVCV
jgi:hypothetical protein